LHTVKKVAELDGNDYHLLGLYIHNAVYTKRDGNTVDGTYIPVLFDDLANLTTSEPGTMPKVYSDVQISDQNDRILVEIGLRGAIWGRMEWKSLVDRAEDYKEKLEREALLLHKYVLSKNPQDQKARPNAGFAAYLENSSGSDTESFRRGQTRTGNSSFHFDAHDWKRLPTLHHVVSRLAELPVFEVVEASVVNNVGPPNFREMKRID
jgi:hypothetical protein